MLSLPGSPPAASLKWMRFGTEQRGFGADVLRWRTNAAPTEADLHGGSVAFSLGCRPFRTSNVQVPRIGKWNGEKKFSLSRCEPNVAPGETDFLGAVVGLRTCWSIVGRSGRRSCTQVTMMAGSTREVKLNTFLQARASSSNESDAPAAERPAIMVNSLAGKMGRATAEAVVAAGLRLVPFTLAGSPGTEKDVYVKDVHVQVRDKSEREEVLVEVLGQYPDVVIVDYTVPQAVNDNAEFYCRQCVPFVMGTTGGDRAKLMKDVLKSGNYAVIAPQMGKQVVAFQAAMQTMAERFPGAFSGYKLQVTESHQSSKLDTSGTAKAVVESFVKLGLDFDVSEIEKVRDPKEQIKRMTVPEDYLLGHAYHTYRLVSPDNTVSFQFQHNVCGRSIYAEGTVDAVLFLAKKVEQKTEMRVFNMIDVLREGNMR